MQTNDYLRQPDLNGPAAGIAVINPLDPRALFMFGFTATGQEVRNLGPYTIFVSFDFAYDQGIPSTPMQPAPVVHAVLAPGEIVRREAHTRGHLIAWIDPAAAPQPGIAAQVRVHAWA